MCGVQQKVAYVVATAVNKIVRAELVPLKCELISYETFHHFIYHYHYTQFYGCVHWVKGIVPFVLNPQASGIHNVTCNIT